jgi:hypothetical protein
MLTRLCFALTLAGAAAAQQTVAPTDAQVGPPRGENTGDYNVTQSFELGYRWRLVGGDDGMYRSVANYGNGVRLLGSHFTINSRDGHGGLFDEILLTTIGLGNDPYQSAILRIQKNSLYRYDFNWRSQDYYNPALTIVGLNGLSGTPALTLGSTPALLASGGLHLRDTERRMQDHDLTLLPQSRFRFRVGYSRNVEDGPALSTAQEFDPNGTAFPIYADIRREWNEYRVGGDVDFAGFTLSITRRWGYFKEDTPYSFIAASASASPGDLTALSQFSRSEPIHGNNSGWLGNLTTRRRFWALNARATYSSGARNFIQNEAAFGTSQFGGAASRQILVSGNASRPSTAGDLALSFFPIGPLTIVNNTSILTTRIDGPSSYSEVETGIDLGTTVNFRFFGVRTVVNSTDVNLRIIKQFGIYGAYRYSDREVRYEVASELPGVPGSATSDTYRVSNHLNTGVFGVRVRPWKPLTVNLEGELGRANFPLTPVSEKTYHNLNGRIEYRARRVQLSTAYRQNYNLNGGPALTYFNSHSRQYTANGSWSPRDSFSIDASYVKLHLDTRGGIAFFASTGVRPTLQSDYASYYVSNIHSGSLSARFGIRRRADLSVGYAITKDTGDGRASPFPTTSTDPIGNVLSSVQTFPLTYHAPFARVSIRITPKVRWNAGYQFYNYAEDFHLYGYNQNFHAHTGFTSVLWSF